jgi:hypothetical protein
MHLSESYLIANCGVTVARMQSVHEVSSDAQRVRAPSAQQECLQLHVRHASVNPICHNFTVNKKFKKN